MIVAGCATCAFVVFMTDAAISSFSGSDLFISDNSVFLAGIVFPALWLSIGLGIPYVYFDDNASRIKDKIKQLDNMKDILKIYTK